MATKEMAHQYRLAQWAALTKERGELGMSIRSYCAMKGFAENTYFYWQRRLRDAAAAQLENGQASLAAPQFAQVALVPATEASAAASQTGQLHVEIKGIHLSVDSSYPLEKLAGSIALKNAAEALKGRRTLTAEFAAGLIDKVKISPDGSVKIEWKVEGAALAHQ